MAKIVINRAPHFLIALERAKAKAMWKWLMEMCDPVGWSFTACSFVGNSRVPENYNAKIQYSALTFADDGYAFMFKLMFTDEAMEFEDYQAGIRRTLVPKKGYQMSDHPNADMWLGPRQP